MINKIFFISFLLSSSLSLVTNKINNVPLSYEENQMELIDEIDQDGFIEEDSMIDETSLTTPSDNVNFVNYNLLTKTKTFEIFEENNNSQRSTSAENIALASNSNTDISTTSIIGDDTRTQISNPKVHPYLPTAKMVITYKNVYNKSSNTYKTRKFYGTAFLEGPNLAVSAGHCCYDDVTNEGNYEDNTYNPRFPSSIEFYFGCNSASDMNSGSSYTYYAKAKIINLEIAYYQDQNSNHDWSAIVLDRNIGYSTGWYGKISNWYSLNYSIYSWGYPGDKTMGTLWETTGKLTDSSTFKYRYDMDTYSGQSGSPIFMETSNGDVYVCGIHTSGNSIQGYNSGIRFNSLVYGYLNSFVSSNNNSYNYDPLVLGVNGKSGSNWSISITNNSSHIRTVSFNTKMCNFSDAKNWTNLSDVSSLTISPYKSTIVSISTNWFATSITACYYYNNKQVITYANELNSSKYSLTQYTNII